MDPWTRKFLPETIISGICRWVFGGSVLHDSIHFGKFRNLQQIISKEPSQNPKSHKKGPHTENPIKQSQPIWSNWNNISPTFGFSWNFRRSHPGFPFQNSLPFGGQSVVFSVARMMPHLCIEAHRLALRTWKTALTIGPCPAIRARRVIHIHLVESNGKISRLLFPSMDDYSKEQVFTWISCVYVYVHKYQHLFIYYIYINIIYTVYIDWICYIATWC